MTRRAPGFPKALAAIRALGSHPKTIVDPINFVTGMKGSANYTMISGAYIGVGGHQSVRIIKPISVNLMSRVLTIGASEDTKTFDLIEPEMNVNVTNWRFKITGRNNGTQDAEVRAFWCWPKVKLDADDIYTPGGTVTAGTTLDSMGNWIPVTGGAASAQGNTNFPEMPLDRGTGTHAAAPSSLQWEWSPMGDKQWSRIGAFKLARRKILKPGDAITLSFHRKNFVLNRKAMGVSIETGQLASDTTAPAVMPGHPLLFVCVRGTISHAQDESKLVTDNAVSADPALIPQYSDYMVEWLGERRVRFFEAFGHQFGVLQAVKSLGYLGGPTGIKFFSAQAREQIQPVAPAQENIDV